MSDHGHGDPHGSAPEAPHGPAVLPDAPAERMITPAREDYAQPFPGAGLLWPAVWLLCAVALWQGASRWSGPVVHEHEAHEVEGEGSEHGRMDFGKEYDVDLVFDFVEGGAAADLKRWVPAGTK